MTEASYDDVIGLTVDEAIAKLADRGITNMRAMTVDGKSLFGTCDWQPTRLNVSTQDGKIVSVGRTG